MTKRGILATLIGLLVLALIACGPAAVPDTGETSPAVELVTQAQQENPTAEAPEPPPKPTVTPTPFPTKPPIVLPTKIPVKTPVPRARRPAATPVPEHPIGLAGCKDMSFYEYPSHVVYSEWCIEQLSEAVISACEQKETDAERRQCGDNIAQEYRVYYLRYGLSRCMAMSERAECIDSSFRDWERVLSSLWEATAKVRIVGDRSLGVSKAMDEMVACLENKGFEKVDRSLLLGWQTFESPQDSKAQKDDLSPEEKDFKSELREPTHDCAKQVGLYDAQKVAWATELRRLDKEESALATDLIREGMLEILEKPGIPNFLTGEVDPLILHHFKR